MPKREDDEWETTATPHNTPVLVLYKDMWRGPDFVEQFEAVFDGAKWTHKAKNRRVYENGTRCQVLGWKHKTPNATGNGPRQAQLAEGPR